MNSLTKSPLAALEKIKTDSRFLRGTIVEGLADPVTGAIADSDTKLLKFHGSYMQDDRDIRDERRKRKLEPDYGFMVRVRLPGGIVTPQQWLALDNIATTWAKRGLRITTRQTFQLHSIAKKDLRPVMRTIHDAMATTLAACGDVNRQVISSVNPLLSNQHRIVQDWTEQLSAHFLPRTHAYAEIWLGEKKVTEDIEEEPLYGRSYLPRKFKIGIAIPPINDIDVFANDLGLIAIIENDKLLGFNVAVGGGMGATHGDVTTYPRLGSLIGFIETEQVIALADAVVTVQRDFGNREERQHARLKYTIDRLGLEWFTEELERRLGFALQPVRDYHFDHNGDRFGWIKGEDDQWHLGLYIASGRIWDQDGLRLLTGLRQIAQIHKGEFRLTCNQNMIIANVATRDKSQIDKLVVEYGLDGYKQQSGIRRYSVACVALPTCGLAMAESERYLSTILTKLEMLLDTHGLLDEPIQFRISGCPNGCSRPYLGEIALIGRAIGRYDLRLGADFTGQRLNIVYRENVTEPEILETLNTLFAAYATDRRDTEKFGDYLVRSGTLAKPTENLMPIVLRVKPRSATGARTSP